jgi:hypothetical protein
VDMRMLEMRRRTGGGWYSTRAFFTFPTSTWEYLDLGPAARKP